jgi:hypothetical protein
MYTLSTPSHVEKLLKEEASAVEVVVASEEAEVDSVATEVDLEVAVVDSAEEFAQTPEMTAPKKR